MGKVCAGVGQVLGTGSAGSRQRKKGLGSGITQTSHRPRLKFRPGHSPALGLGRGSPPPTHMFLIKKLSERAVARMKGDTQERPGCEAKPSLSPACSTPVQYLACSAASPLPYPLIGNLNSTPGAGS